MHHQVGLTYYPLSIKVGKGVGKKSPTNNQPNPGLKISSQKPQKPPLGKLFLEQARGAYK